MKKILCLVLSAMMIFSCLSVGMTASALTSKDWRPKEVADIIDPIILGKDTIFAKNFDEIGYESVNDYAKNGLSISEDSFDSFLAANADDKMFGVDFDFLYSKDNRAFLWSFLDYKLEPEFSDSNISILLDGADTVENFRAWAAKLGRDFTIHDIEMYAASKSGKRSSCGCKSRYDACAAILAGYDYDYSRDAEKNLPGKTEDVSIFKGIVEKKEFLINPFTGNDETHYDYTFKFSKGEFGLMRANSNNQYVNVIKTVWGEGAIFDTPQKATENAIKLANFIGNLINPNFKEIKKDTKVFTDNKRIYDEVFFEKVTTLSGLDIVLQAKWCNAKLFDVRDIMSALGVNVKDDVIYDAELTKGVNMGTRILTDMYSAFFSDPVGYVVYLLQLFSQSYEHSYKTAINELFEYKLNSMVEKSRYGSYELLDEYTGSELDTVDGLLGFIVDSIYVKKVDNGNTGAGKFSFAPLPLKRIATAADINERYLYILCYLELNRIYNGNAAFIDNFINSTISSVNALYEGEDKEDAVKDLKTVMESMFKGNLTFSGETGIYTFHLGVLTENVIQNFPTNFENTVKKALANFLQSFIDAIENLVNLLFGWTEGLFGGGK